MVSNNIVALLGLALLFCFPSCRAGEARLARTTVSVLSEGKEVAAFMLPVGKSRLNFKANRSEVDEQNGTLRASGNVQVSVSLPNAQSLTIYGDELLLRKETIDPVKARAIKDLEDMGRLDQSIRGRANAAQLTAADWARQERIDLRNMKRLKAIIERYGWPGVRFGGAAASANAFLVLQHADSESQRTYLPLLREAVQAKQAHASDMALLEDRVRVGLGQMQLYGSQIRPTEPATVFPIEDEENVDVRRRAIGLQPLAEYLNLFGISYPPK
jgi:hypothetical protein